MSCASGEEEAGSGFVACTASYRDSSHLHPVFLVLTASHQSSYLGVFSMGIPEHCSTEMDSCHCLH